MKSNRKKRILAAILCMVMVLTNNVSVLAEGEGVPSGETTVAEETPTVVSETTPDDAANVSPTEESEPETPAVEETPEAPEETPAPEPEVPEQTAPEETVPEETTPETPEQTTPEAPASPATPETPNAPEESQPTEPETPAVPEQPVLSEAKELNQEFRDGSGNLVQKITAKLPAGAFEAETSAITMEVNYVNASSEEYLKGMMTAKLPEGNELGDYFLYKIEFKVNGEAKTSLKPIEITFAKSDLEVKDTKKANVFYLDPAVSGDKDEIVEITQRSELIESFQAAGKSTANIDEDYDLSTIEVGADQKSGKIVLEGRKSTIYGCYVEKEPKAAPEEPQAEEPDGETEATPEEPENKEEKQAELKYEDDQVVVSVTESVEGAIPEGAALKVVPITSEDNETKAQYEEVEKKIQEKVAEEDKVVAGFLAYDITFVDAEGNEIEPNGKVKVSMNYKKPELPEEVKENGGEDAEVSVLHLEEDEAGNVKEVVDMNKEEAAKVDALTTTEGPAVQNVEAETESFSVFAITWETQLVALGENVYTVKWKNQGEYGKRPTAKIHFVNENGEDIGNTLKVSEKTIYVSGTGNLGENSSTTDWSGEKAFNKDLNEIGKQYNSNGNYYFAGARLEKYNSNLVASDISYNPKGGGSAYWHYLNNGWQHWKDKGNAQEIDVYLIYANSKLTTIGTLDTSSKITMNIQDLSGIVDNYFEVNDKRIDIGGHYQKDITSGLVENKLENGFPTATQNKAGNLSSLFGKGWDANNLFSEEQYNATGYYEYSSFDNYAYFNKGTGDFTVYNQLGTPVDSDLKSEFFYNRGNFMPFNKIEVGRLAEKSRNLYDEDGNPLSENDERYGELLYKTEDPNNYLFSMYLDAEFTQMQGGMVTHNNKTNPMIYEFNGDDDLWVYIDNVLVLDLGGVHDAASGKIDFSDGTVYVKGKPTTTIKAMFRAAGVFPDGTPWVEEKAGIYFNGNTFTDFSNHKFNMFYMERGGGASNLYVKFNIPFVPKNTINVQKVVTDKTGASVNYAEDIDFKFAIKVDGALYKNQAYTLLRNEVEVPGSYSTDANGEFTLKHNEKARFSDIKANQKYQVKELGAYLDGYNVWIDGTYVTQKPEGGEGNTLHSAESGELVVGNISTVVFRNELEKSAKLEIQKKLKKDNPNNTEVFKIQLYLNGKPYVGSYNVGETEIYLTEKDKGIIELQANQIASVTGLPYGAKFEVKELVDGGYLPEYEITGAVIDKVLPEKDENGTIINEVYSASGQIDGDCQVVVTNEKVEIGAGTTTVTVDKEWKVPTGYELPKYVTVTLYQDKNSDGKYSEGDVQVSGYESKKLEADTWHAEWTNLPGDVDYVVKEEFPPGYTMINPIVDNELTEITKIGDKHSPNNETIFDIGKNNILFIKLANNAGTQYDKNTKFLLWTPTNLNLTDDIETILKQISPQLNGDGNPTVKNTQYVYGNQAGIVTIKSNDKGWKLDFEGESAWALFWRFSYLRTQQIQITNVVDEESRFSIPVEKQWIGATDEELINNQVKIQLYLQKESGDVPYGEPITLTYDPNRPEECWKYEFTNLPYYEKNDQGEIIGKYNYTVKEIEINGNPVDESGKADGYQSIVEKKENPDGTISFVIRNIKDWQIIKVSENSNDVTLKGALFRLSKDGFKVYGISDDEGVIKWYQDEGGNSPYTEVFQDGEYTFEELRAPEGYAKSNEKWTISINKGCPIIKKQNTSTLQEEILEPVTKDGKYTYYFKNTPLYDLPSAGGSGIFKYIMSGTLLMIAAILMLYKMKNKGVLKG